MVEASLVVADVIVEKAVVVVAVIISILSNNNTVCKHLPFFILSAIVMILIKSIF